MSLPTSISFSFFLSPSLSLSLSFSLPLYLFSLLSHSLYVFPNSISIFLNLSFSLYVSSCLNLSLSFYLSFFSVTLTLFLSNFIFSLIHSVCLSIYSVAFTFFSLFIFFPNSLCVSLFVSTSFSFSILLSFLIFPSSLEYTLSFSFFLYQSFTWNTDGVKSLTEFGQAKETLDWSCLMHILNWCIGSTEFHITALHVCQMPLARCTESTYSAFNRLFQ